MKSKRVRIIVFVVVMLGVALFKGYSDKAVHCPYLEQGFSQLEYKEDGSTAFTLTSMGEEVLWISWSGFYDSLYWYTDDDTVEVISGTPIIYQNFKISIYECNGNWFIKVEKREIPENKIFCDSSEKVFSSAFDADEASLGALGSVSLIEKEGRLAGFKDQSGVVYCFWVEDIVVNLHKTEIVNGLSSTLWLNGVTIDLVEEGAVGYLSVREKEQDRSIIFDVPARHGVNDERVEEVWYKWAFRYIEVTGKEPDIEESPLNMCIFMGQNEYLVPVPESVIDLCTEDAW